MRRHVFCPSDLGDSSVGSHHDQGRQFVLESTVKEREAFDVEHMHFVNEEDLARRRDNQTAPDEFIPYSLLAQSLLYPLLSTRTPWR